MFHSVFSFHQCIHKHIAHRDQSKLLENLLVLYTWHCILYFFLNVKYWQNPAKGDFESFCLSNGTFVYDVLILIAQWKCDIDLNTLCLSTDLPSLPQIILHSWAVWEEETLRSAHLWCYHIYISLLLKQRMRHFTQAEKETLCNAHDAAIYIFHFYPIFIFNHFSRPSLIASTRSSEQLYVTIVKHEN